MNNKIIGLFGIILTTLGLILSFNIFKHYTVIFVLGNKIFLSKTKLTKYEYLKNF